MQALVVPVLAVVVVCMALCPAYGTDLTEEREPVDDEALSLNLFPYSETQQQPEDVPGNALISYLMDFFSQTPPHQLTYTLSGHPEREVRFRSDVVPKRLYYAPRLGKRDSSTSPSDTEGQREKREAAGNEGVTQEAENYAKSSWWWPLVTVRRSPFMPRPGKRENDAAGALYNAEDLQEEGLDGYLKGDFTQDQLAIAKREPGFAFSPRLGKRDGIAAFSPRLGKKNFAFVPRPGKKEDFAFSPRLGKRADFAFVPRPGRRGDFAFSPRLGKKADFAFSPRLGKKADFAFSPRLGKRGLEA